MESPTHSVVDASLGTLSVILSILDFSTIKNDIFPIIAAVFSKTSSLGIKIRGLEALQVLCGGTPGQDADGGDGLDGFGPSGKSKKRQQSVILDKYTIQEKVVPLLKGIKTKEPAVMMAALAVFEEVGKIADSDFLAMDVLPLLWAFSLGPLLNLQQFQAFMSLIRSLSTRIEQEQTRKLQDLSATSATSANRNDFLSSVSASRSNGLESPAGEDGDFESLVLGRKKPENGVSNAMSNLSDGWGAPESSNARPTTLRTQSNQNTSPTPPAFSWSTPSPPAQAIRPAPPVPMSSFAPLQVNTSMPTSSLSQPLQPARPTTSTLTPTPSYGQSTPQNKPLDWSNTMSPSSNPWAAVTPASTASTSSTSSNVWGQNASPHRPASNPTFGQPVQQNPSAFTIAPSSSASPYSAFSLPPPPGGGLRQSSYGAPASGGMGMAQPRIQQQQQAQQQLNGGGKQGLDKYESLI
jgi:SCY1-like protein 2